MDGNPTKDTLIKGMAAFRDLGITVALQKQIRNVGFKSPTPIQKAMIPLALKDHDIIASAYTGSGKTMAYLLPLFQQLGEHEPSSAHIARGIIIAPTRDLVLQIARVCDSLGATPATNTKTGRNSLRYGVILGEESFESQFALLATRKPDILIATPGRILGIAMELEAASPPIRLFNNMKYLIMDEADQLVEPDHKEAVMDILKKTRGVKGVQARWLVSATMPTDLASLIANAQLSGMGNVKTVMMDSAIPSKLEMGFVCTRTPMKLPAFFHFITEILDDYHTGFARPKKDVKAAAKKTIVFVQSKYHVDFLVNLLRHVKKAQVFGVHGSMSTAERDKNMDGFRNTRRYFPILVTTDVGARGVDIPDVDLVINYDFPSTRAQVLVHRAGRTARAGKTGRCISFLTPEELPFLAEFLPSLNRKLVTPDGQYLAGGEGAQSAVITDHPMCLEVDDIVAKLSKYDDKEDPSCSVTIDGLRVDLASMKSAMDNSVKAKVKERIGSGAMRTAKQWLTNSVHVNVTDDATNTNKKNDNAVWFGQVAAEVYGPESHKHSADMLAKDAFIRGFGSEDKVGKNKSGLSCHLGLQEETKNAMELLRKSNDLKQYKWVGDKIDMSLESATERLAELKRQRELSGVPVKQKNKRRKVVTPVVDSQIEDDDRETAEAVIGDASTLSMHTMDFGEGDYDDMSLLKKGARKWEVAGKYAKWQKSSNGSEIAQIGVRNKLDTAYERSVSDHEEDNKLGAYDIMTETGEKEKVPYEELTRDKALIEAIRKNLKMTAKQNRKLRKIQKLWLKNRTIAESDVDVMRKGAAKSLMEQQRSRTLKEHAAVRRAKMKAKKEGKSLAKKKAGDGPYFGGKSKIQGLKLKGKFQQGFKEVTHRKR